MALLPDVPTISEAGLPGYESTVYNSLLGPRGVPRNIVDRLQAEIDKAGRNPQIKARFEELGIVLDVSSPENLVDFIKVEMTKWSKIIRDAGIPPQQWPARWRSVVMGGFARRGDGRGTAAAAGRRRRGSSCP